MAERAKQGSERAARVQALLGQGKSEAQVASELGISQQRVNQLKAKAPADDSQKGLQQRFMQAKTETQEWKAVQERLKAEAMGGNLIARDQVEDLVLKLRGRLTSASTSLRKLKNGKEAVEVLTEAVRGVDDDLKALLEGE